MKTEDGLEMERSTAEAVAGRFPKAQAIIKAMGDQPASQSTTAATQAGASRPARP
jgi:hypothetical protein